MTLRVAVVIILFAGAAHAFSCVAMSVEHAVERADVVFRGTVVEIHDAKRDIITDVLQPRKQIAVFRVTRVWKGNVGETFEVALRSFGPYVACSDWEQDARIGNELLVYSRRSNNGEYVTSACSRTKPVSRADTDFQQLGPGRTPEMKITPVSDGPVH